MLKFTLLAATAVVIAACSQSPSQKAQDISLIASSLETELPQLTIIPALAPKLPQIEQSVSDAKSAADAFAMADAQTQSNLVTRIVDDASAVLADVAAAPGIPPNVQTAMTAIGILLPTIETINTVTAGSAKGAMTPDQARAVLKALK
jgi:hypothetical protein